MCKRILMIDDDAELCQEMAELLSDEGYTVDTAFDGVAGLDCFCKNNYDFILLDIKMPKITGFDVLRYIRASESKIKIIVVTGNLAASQLLKEGTVPLSGCEEILRQADAIMAKPFHVETLLTTLKKLS